MGQSSGNDAGQQAVQPGIVDVIAIQTEPFGRARAHRQSKPSCQNKR